MVRPPTPTALSRDRRAARGRRPSRPTGGGAGTIVAAGAFGFIVSATIAGGIAWSSGCRGEAPPAPATDLSERTTSLPAPPPASTSVVAALPDGGTPHEAVAPDDKPYTGPLIGALAMQTPIYPTPEFTKEKLGYIRLGG